MTIPGREGQTRAGTKSNFHCLARSRDQNEKTQARVVRAGLRRARGHEEANLFTQMLRVGGDGA